MASGIRESLYPRGNICSGVHIAIIDQDHHWYLIDILPLIFLYSLSTGQFHKTQFVRYVHLLAGITLSVLVHIINFHCPNS